MLPEQGRGWVVRGGEAVKDYPLHMPLFQTITKDGNWPGLALLVEICLLNAEIMPLVQ